MELGMTGLETSGTVKNAGGRVTLLAVALALLVVLGLSLVVGCIPWSMRPGGWG